MRTLELLHISLHSAAASDVVGDGGEASDSPKENPPSEIFSRSLPSHSSLPVGTSGKEPEGLTSRRLRTQLRLEAKGPT